MRWTIPNILTIARVIAAPMIGLIYVLFDRPAADWIALALFIGASLTDFVDGYIARRFNQGSAFGKMLDPIADKAMVIITCAVVLGLFGLTVWIVLPLMIILLREVLVSGLREFLGEVKLDVTQLAKWKTTAQMVALSVLLGASALDAGGSDLAGMVMGGGLALLWLAAVLTAVTGWDYFAKALPVLTERDKG
ncbi:CDP-diacylglycerol--glycerol-3-phosphate 3-phosphatidyltransferase [Rubricella aquisinus]|uniref:CDP-diacylglycerol--glycerol-3-phosphate 3-phosphatidyltransferase n=1 Tax=Rubricella aquisinus TaxID=2028108 RepID=A0A840WPD8_9RHOB|nr:CDP-diacylglycerol--glycerol-3-phosphate 3-phosphatidyltransferase [Rubricella aquisinus]MBB5516909.1 CDP-diacylglycerol--glycerol-3-phosphate 3-phosphatidyltransferase [Rubricella aquisinus]